MALTFAAVATLAAVAGGWAVAANEYSRYLALVLLAIFGLTLWFPALSERLARPLVALGGRLSESAPSGSFVSSLGLGVATGLLWAPCAGPILGLVLTGAALEGASVGTTLALIAYAGGAATSLALALLIGGRVNAFMRRSLLGAEWLRPGLGVAVLAGVAAIATGLDRGYLSELSLASTSGIEQALVDLLDVRPAGSAAVMTKAGMPVAARAQRLRVEGSFPPLAGAVDWINSPPLTAEGLRGKVVLIDFWTYSCINCIRTLPYLQAWAKKYKDAGLVVIGVHTPEFAFERKLANVRKATKDLGIDYPVAADQQPPSSTPIAKQVKFEVGRKLGD
jgi:cytochrome c biogenesis protein CcdA/thiol-disulfide isomerase/thioredoxin